MISLQGMAYVNFILCKHRTFLNQVKSLVANKKHFKNIVVIVSLVAVDKRDLFFEIGDG